MQSYMGLMWYLSQMQAEATLPFRNKMFFLMRVIFDRMIILQKTNPTQD